MRKEWCFIVSLLAFFFLSAQVFAHPTVTLKDQNGNLVNETGYPVSVRKSCGQCHNIDFIDKSYHFQQGRLALLPKATYRKDYYDKYGNKVMKFGLPPTLSPVMDGGMYGNKVVSPHPLPVGAAEAHNPAYIGLTTPEWAGHCGLCHPGGGPVEKDRHDQFLYKKTRKEIAKELASGKIPGDYVEWSGEKKKLVPFVWKKYGINNVGEPACFLCHSTFVKKDHVALGKYRSAILGGYFAAANTLASGLATSYDVKTGKLHYNMKLDVDKNKKGLQVNGNIINASSDASCAQCHGGWVDDIDGDHKITPLDFFIQLLDPKYCQPDTFKESMIWYYSDKFKDANGVPKDIDVHKEMGLSCTDCHKPMGPSSVKKPSHEFAKGNTGPLHTVRWHQLAGTASCENCHSDPVSFHRRYLGPVASLHMKKISCTLCHISKRYFYRLKVVDETAPIYIVHYDRSTKQVALKGIFVGMGYLWGNPQKGIYADVGLFPVKQHNGSLVWKYKSINIVGLPYFEDNATGKFGPVQERYLYEVLKVDSHLPTLYLTYGKPARIGKGKYLSLKPSVGLIANDKAINSGNRTLVYALPNYIDVNLDGHFDKGDVQITDDTNLKGNGKDGAPEINTLKEVKAAVKTLEKVVASSTGKKGIKVRLVVTIHPYPISHNVRPKQETLTCVDCHGKGSGLSGHMFTSKAVMYYPYDQAAVKAGYVRPSVPRTLQERALAETVKKEIQKLGFKNTKTQ